MGESVFDTNWIWAADWNRDDDVCPRIVSFRKEFTLDKVPEKAGIYISADSRYKLYVNGIFVQEGPQKGYRDTWYKDPSDLAPYLLSGRNVLAVEVLRYPGKMSDRNTSLYRSPYPCLYVEDASESGIRVEGKSGWQAAVRREIEIKRESTNPAPIHIVEEAKGLEAFQGWKQAGYSGSAFQSAIPYSARSILSEMEDAPFVLSLRTIPAMHHEEKRFESVSAVRTGETEEQALVKKQWEHMLSGGAPVEIPAGTTQIVEIDAGAYECGYPVLAIRGGKGAKISFLPAECYSYPQEAKRTPMGLVPQLPRKGNREDAENGTLSGDLDSYTAEGLGTMEEPETYEPFWFRSFRYYQIRVTTKDEGISILSFTYRETGYPLQVRASFRTSDETFSGITDISLRTLRRCMHETYVDCPHYEQLQYAMDSRQEILFTYFLSADDRLARQCMDAFRRSQRADGMVNSCSPCQSSNVIPGFSIYYILMVWDHMMYFGDRDLVREHLPAIDRVLSFFDGHLTDQGLVGSVGGPLFRARYWSFIDWTNEWNDTTGVPHACREGEHSLTMESLLYLYGLLKAAELADYVGRTSTGLEYRTRAKALAAAIRTHCMGQAENGTPLFQDGPGVDEYSVHCQVFAILTGLADEKKGKQMLAETIGNPRYPQASVSFSFYLFLALEQVGFMEKADEVWDTWRDMLRDHLTTCVENDTDARSDCHAWGAAILYVLPAIYLGVRPAAPGFSKVSIRPQPGHLTFAEGDIALPQGLAHVRWEKKGDSLDLSYTLPDGTEKV